MMHGGTTQKPYTGRNRRTPDKWHVEKGIPIAVILIFVGQTFAGVWGMSALQSKVDTAVSTINELKAQAYTSSDARRDRELMDQKIKNQDGTIQEVIRRVTANETALDRLDHDRDRSRR